jgi:hypothetical protein
MRDSEDLEAHREALMRRNCALRDSLPEMQSAEMPLEFLDSIDLHAQKMEDREGPHAFFADCLLRVGEEHVRRGKN